MASQKLREQVESKNSLIIDVDNTIKSVCEKIKNEAIPPEQEPGTIKALALLVTARAILG